MEGPTVAHLEWTVTWTSALGWNCKRPRGTYGDEGFGSMWVFTGTPVLHTQLFANESVPDHVGYAKVKITLINENDNRPIFSQPLYNISLYENVTVGTSVLTVLVSPHIPAGPLSSGADHEEAAKGVLPKELGQSGRGCPQVPRDVVVEYECTWTS